MNYELAKKLKDAGFPQHIEDDLDYDRDGIEVVFPSGERVYVPSLSELIDACGEDFEALVRINKPKVIWWAYPTEEWHKNSKHSYVFDCYRGKRGEYECGLEPEEAVAKLWLKLKEK